MWAAECEAHRTACTGLANPIDYLRSVDETCACAAEKYPGHFSFLCSAMTKLGRDPAPGVDRLRNLVMSQLLALDMRDEEILQGI